ncbi:hypothetical protein FACS189428_4820 [Clostridia bacterium]|nr:hypothetical protein FACS189428_4820 [Clostridia bacterium]
MPGNGQFPPGAVRDIQQIVRKLKHKNIGIRYWFVPYYVGYSILKSMVFGFIIVSTASYYGYNVKGGALQVGKASTNSVVMSSVLILAMDLVMTQIMLGK